MEQLWFGKRQFSKSNSGYYLVNVLDSREDAAFDWETS